MRYFVSPELEGATDSISARSSLLAGLMEMRLIRKEKIDTKDGQLFRFATIEKTNLTQNLFSLDVVKKLFGTRLMDSTFRTIADMEIEFDITIDNQTGLTSTEFVTPIASLIELYNSPYWFTVYSDAGLLFTRPLRNNTSVYRGRLANDRIITRRVLTPGTVKLWGETGCDFLLFPSGSLIVPASIDSTLKDLVFNKYLAGLDTMTFAATFQANPLDWVYGPDGGIYIILSKRTPDFETGEYIYTAVLESSESNSYSTGSFTPPYFPVADENLQVRLNADMVDGRHLTGIYGTAIGCKVRTSANLTMTSADTYYKVVFNTEDYDIGGYFDTSTNRYTPLVHGLYSVKVRLLFGNVADQNDLYIAIYKNGAIYEGHYIIASKAANTPLEFNCDVELDGVDDYIEIYAKAGAGLTSRTVVTNQYYTALHIALLGEIIT